MSEFLETKKTPSLKHYFQRIVIGIDPAVTNGQESHETGIIVAGRSINGLGYVLEDLSIKCHPTAWVQEVLGAYHRWQVDRVVAEINQGGDLVEAMLRTINVSIAYKGVRATRGKHLRAEPVAALYEQGKIFHIQRFSELEEQMKSFTGGASEGTDRLDALVWALTELFLITTKERGGRKSPEAWFF